MKKENSVSRRKFLVTTATAALAQPFLLSPPVMGQTKRNPLRHACVGVGGMGWHDLNRFKAHPEVEIVAICDVDENHLNRAAEALPNAKKYTDWRELLENEAGNFDAINVSVPDHNHFPIAIQSIKQGKHVYCQKPMCHDVAEIRKLTEAAGNAGIVSQLGTQHASGKGDRTAVQWIKEGHIGKIKEVYLCSNRPGATEAYRFEGPRPEGGENPPLHLHWDLFIGTAPMRPYAPAIYHPAKWRAWQDFGTGWSGDIGCHILDAVWKGLELTAPKSVVAKVQESWEQSPERRADSWPQSNHITWIFPGNKHTAADELKVEWFDGEFYPPEDIRSLYSLEDYPAESAMLVGTEGALLIPHTKMPVLLPAEKFRQVSAPVLEERDHYHHFVDACLGKVKTESHFGMSGPMSETVILGTVAIRQPNQVLEWDAGSMKILNSDAANQYLSREYRKGWEIV
ncbi:Oxidoreductase family, NAD-binding Rossmann fold [Cyclobacterium lianum]|uniref:Oxidoreductase family, NAD-binding Rossmann fold n=1 Tax=Cyclobacterium lianum TaxID=388280 RepID=A0A1M7LNG2_9BACT|nr:Gfo/Idh/MocA family oxidoreductase [Cyclobacterium lianum]SHM79739.1 Oxidoreductase family, NAD-binding Rossmann fold [Cyclobacterium lianum]